MNNIELLAPAGSPEALDAAIGAGADAVYFGLKNFNARIRSANFAYSQAEAAVKSLHRMGRKCYLTVNTVFEQREADRMFQLLGYISRIGADGIIVQDFGVVRMAETYFPDLKLHASTQMNLASAKGVNALSKHGISRVVLARELSLDEIRDIRANTNSELEVFVHGALCISESGLCLFSSYLGGKSANRGMCTQACRRYYQCAGTADNAAPFEGGYLFSPLDLQLIEKIPVLAEIGVNACKIEGRMKSADYVGTVTSAYRCVMDALGGTQEQVAAAIARSRATLRNDFARAKTVFRFDRPAENEVYAIDYLMPEQTGGTGIPLGTIRKTRAAGTDTFALLTSAADTGGDIPPLAVGDTIRLHKADDSQRLSHKITALEKPDAATDAISSGGSGAANHAAGGVWVSVPQGFGFGDSVFLIQTKAASRRYAEVLPRNLDTFRRTPGHESAPHIMLPPTAKPNGKTGGRGGAGQAFPEGLYAAVSRVSDLYVLQSVRPVKALLSYSRKTAAYLSDDNKPPLPFPAADVVLVLDPYFPQDLDARFAEEIPDLIKQGFTRFVVNNPAHFAFFRGTSAKLIAGPYLYAFNRFSAAFAVDFGAELFVSPLENNRQNLEKTFDPPRRAGVFVTIFAYPALFRIRDNLGPLYRFSNFSDSQGAGFSLLADIDGSTVIPEDPFSIVDKVPFLREAGFKRFIVDFSGPPLKKNPYKDVMSAAKSGAPLPGITRFNWKDGFYQE